MAKRCTGAAATYAVHINKLESRNMDLESVPRVSGFSGCICFHGRQFVPTSAWDDDVTDYLSAPLSIGGAVHLLSKAPGYMWTNIIYRAKFMPVNCWSVSTKIFACSCAVDAHDHNW